MSGGSGSGPLVPTFHGFVHNSMDGLLLFEACLSGKLHHVPRRPHDRERASLIKSGSIFIYEENASGIKRWTDGVAWSPSRILGNFLIYRELEKPFPPGEKKRAMKRKRSAQQLDGQEQAEVKMPPTPPSPKPAPEHPADATGQDGERELDRQLIGSLVDSYGFRPDGLVKKTMSIAINGVSHHLVSYYKVDDVKKSILRRPIEEPRLQGITVRPELYMKQNFRTPVEDGETYMGMDPNAYHQQPYGQMMAGGYGMRPGPYMQSPGGYAMYGQQPSAGGVYAPVANGWTSTPAGYPSGGYASHAYSDYYRNAGGAPQSSMVKGEEQGQHGLPSYSTPSYPPRPTSSGYSNIPSQYQAPMRPGSATYPPSNSVHPPSSGPSPQSYSAPGTASHNGPYSSPAPATSYSEHPAQHSTAGADKSPQAPSSGAPPMQYRASAYGQDASYQGQGYASYATQAQSYRPPLDGVSTAASTQAQY